MSESSKEALHHRRVVLIGVGGSSASGKSTVANRLVKELGSPLNVFSADHYLDIDRVRRAGSWETPAGIAWEHLRSDLENVVAALKEATSLPHRLTIGGFSRGHLDLVPRSLGGSPLGAEPVVVVIEGFLLFHDKQVCDMLDLHLWLETDRDTCASRRHKRDCPEMNFDRYREDFVQDVWHHHQLYRSQQLDNVPNVMRMDSAVRPHILTKEVAKSYRAMLESKSQTETAVLGGTQDRALQSPVAKVTNSWSRGAHGYINALDPWATPLALQLALSIGAEKSNCTSLLEVGAGSGSAAKLLQTARETQTAGFRHVVTDLVEPMVQACRARLPAEVEVLQANAEELPFPDSSFDRYVASLCLMITPDASKMLEECFRVLKPGGYAAFSVWGDKSKSPMMTIPPASLKSCGFANPSARSNFYLAEDKLALRAMVLKAGFSSMHSWHNFAFLPGANDPASYVKLMEEGSPSFAGMAASCPKLADKQKWHEEMERRAQEVLDCGDTIGTDVLCFIAKKPAADGYA